MTSPREWRFGAHVFRWEAPDRLWAVLEGDNNLEDARQMVLLIRTLAEQGPIFLVADFKTAGALEPEARRFISEHVRSAWFQGFIFYNTRLLHRAVARGLILAAELFHAMKEASVAHQRIHFVSSEGHALALLAQLRGQNDAPHARD